MGKILLQDLEFYAYHGVLSEEQKIGGKYKVDLELEADLAEALKSDELDSTINYAEVYEAVKREMEIPSKLIEHVAGRIVKVLLKEFEQLDSVYVRVTKIKPPIHGRVNSVAVVIEERRKK